MERTIKIDDKQVKFKATATTPRLYRQLFQRDLFIDIDMLGKEHTKSVNENRPLTSEVLEIFYLIAYTMAKQADPEAVPDDIDEWLEGFGIFSIYQILPKILQLWGINTKSTVNAKKKAKGKRNGS